MEKEKLVYKRSNCQIVELDKDTGQIIRIVGYRYKLEKLNDPGFTTVYAGKLCKVLKFDLDGLDFDDLTILKIQPATDNSTIEPLHHFVQSYNGYRVLLFVYCCMETEDGKVERCLYNGTDKYLTEFSLPTKFKINERLYLYESETWKTFPDQN